MGRDGGSCSGGGLHDVEVEVAALRGELQSIRARSSGQWAATATGPDGAIGVLLAAAERAARDGRRYLRGPGGSCVEAAYLNVHRAEAEIAKFYTGSEVDAAAPEAVARLRSVLRPGDIRSETVAGLRGAPASEKALRLAQAIRIGHEAKDQQYAKIRRFRNIIVAAAALIGVFMVVFTVLVSWHPTLLPLCFRVAGTDAAWFCPSRSGPGAVPFPSAADVWIVLLLGLLGGALAAAVSVRKIRGAPTPYNLATALAWLKVPSGALTAVGALVLIEGAVVPGLTDLDSQGQILAYALVFGYAQQLLTGLIDRRAGELVEDIPSKGIEGAPGRGTDLTPEHQPVPTGRQPSGARRRTRGVARGR